MKNVIIIVLAIMLYMQHQRAESAQDIAVKALDYAKLYQSIANQCMNKVK